MDESFDCESVVKTTVFVSVVTIVCIYYHFRSNKICSKCSRTRDIQYDLIDGVDLTPSGDGEDNQSAITRSTAPTILSSKDGYDGEDGSNIDHEIDNQIAILRTTTPTVQVDPSTMLLGKVKDLMVEFGSLVSKNNPDLQDKINTVAAIDIVNIDEKNVLSMCREFLSVINGSVQEATGGRNLAEEILKEIR